MNKPTAAFALLACAVLAACRREAQPAPPAADRVAEPATAQAPTSTPGQAAPSAPAVRPELLPQTDRVEVGYSAEASGAILRGLRSRQFNAGSPFVLAVRVEGVDAGTAVEVVWTDGSGARLASETKSVGTGVQYLDFSNPDTTNWPAGKVRADVSIAGSTVGGVEILIDRPSAKPA